MCKEAGNIRHIMCCDVEETVKRSVSFLSCRERRLERYWNCKSDPHLLWNISVPLHRLLLLAMNYSSHHHLACSYSSISFFNQMMLKKWINLLGTSTPGSFHFVRKESEFFWRKKLFFSFIFKMETISIDESLFCLLIY